MKLEKIDDILPHEFEDFKKEVTQEIENIAKKFVQNQIEYSQKVFDYSILLLIFANLYYYLLIRCFKYGLVVKSHLNKS